MKEMTNKKKTLIAVIAALVIAVIILVFVLMGCQNNDTSTPDEAAATLTTETIAQQETTEPVTTVTDKVVAEQGLTVNANGEVVDSSGNKVEKNEDGTYTVKTETGETVKVTAEDVKKAPVNNTDTNNGTNKTPANNTKPTTKPNNNASSTTSKVENNKPVNSNTNTGNKKPDTNTSSNTSTKTWHEAEYKYVNHPAEYKDVWIVDKEATTREEPIYEKQWRTICNACGADITSNVADHGYNHMINGENASYHHEQVELQTGTKTVEVPEEGHWEKQLVKAAWTEKVLVREAGYY